jgi:hypothetical protein
MLIGELSPDFEAKAVVNGEIVDNFSLSNFLGQYVVFFFYPFKLFYTNLLFVMLKLSAAPLIVSSHTLLG